MLHKSFLGLPMLLIAASCVPPMAVGKGAAGLASAPAPAQPAAVAGRPLPLPAAEAIAPGEAAAPFVVGTRSERDIVASLQCLTAAIYYEARSESSEGQRAVAQVVLNRVRHPAFPKSVCGVVYQGSRRRTGCQFSFTCDGSMRARRDPASWAQARRIAGAALAGSVYGPVGHATHYHADYVRPWWAAAMRRAVSVGSHIFYRWRGEWGDPQSFRRPLLVAETADSPPRADRPATRGDRSEVDVAFGVRIRRGGPPPRVAIDWEGAAETPGAAGVRVHAGLPAIVDGKVVDAAEIIEAAPVR